MNLILFNDTHFSIKNPVSRTADYNEELFGFLDQIRQLAVHTYAKGILIAGDLFHDKQERARLPYAVLYRLTQWLAFCKSLGITVMAIPGNHDLIHDRYDSLPGRPLGVLFETGLLVNLSWHTVEIDGIRIIGVPWPDAIEPDVFRRVPKGTDVVVAHAYATEEGGTNYGQFCHRYEALGGAAPGVRLWHFGHDHSDHGVYALHNQAKVVNIGALARGAMNTDNIIRRVKVAAVTIQPGDAQVIVQQVVLRQAPAEDVFDLKLRMAKAQEHAQIEAFVKQLSSGLSGLAPDFKQTLQGLPLDAAVRAKVDEYIQKAEVVS